jgi:NADH-quinone oxidoreductase subunit I
MLFGIPSSVMATVKNFFRKPWTWQFPEQVRPRPERYRASFALVHEESGEEACVACLLCEKVCPSQVIRIKAGPKRESPVTGKKRQYLEDFQLDLTACLVCELCVQVCPQDALVMVSVPELAADSREQLVLGKDRLYANEKSPHAWANGTRLLAMQEPPKPPPAAKPEAAAAAVKIPQPVAPAAAAGVPEAGAPAAPARIVTGGAS